MGTLKPTEVGKQLVEEEEEEVVVFVRRRIEETKKKTAKTAQKNSKYHCTPPPLPYLKIGEKRDFFFVLNSNTLSRVIFAPSHYFPSSPPWVLNPNREEGRSKT